MSLSVGDKAPNFESIDQDGNPITLEQFRGKRVILYFYPKDNTPGCTAQSCNLRDNYQVLLKQGYVVLGISSDSPRKHRNFIKKYDLPFPLIADEDTSVHELYGTWGEKQMFGKKFMGTYRTTFVIDEKGTIEEIINKVNTEDHTSQILQ
ncbi:thioredoxin-dependent thiol peroxidase [Marinoscillum sp. MHG1-6]|uniref:thioredoxin-dependent thiol peroxidase n=1 Tax=Marinoscillum sp. MHG1-6 TaxID=2959627 RepID=UPI002157E2A9|nr:thioredoxin-dependent thiol peroxidase [Marinoscillum sp. MHG1-6]